MSTLAFSGGGRMASALIDGLIAHGGDARSIRAADVSRDARASLAKTLPAANIFSSTSEMLRAGQAVLLIAVKPQQIEEVIADAGDSKNVTMVLSVAAGITTRRIESGLGRSIPVIRAMPNTPALVGRGVTAIAPGRFARPEDMAAARSILESVGVVVETSESDLDAVTAVSGSGPAYFFLFMKALTDAGVELGLDRAVAARLVMETAAGAAALARARNGAFDEMIAAVASKGGTTERALGVFRDRGLEEIVREAAEAAAVRSKELGE
jgi:pyrroline-5-carboxylate reductase